MVQDVNAGLALLVQAAVTHNRAVVHHVAILSYLCLLQMPRAMLLDVHVPHVQVWNIHINVIVLHVWEVLILPLVNVLPV